MIIPEFYNTLTHHIAPLKPSRPGPDPQDPLNGAEITLYS